MALSFIQLLALLGLCSTVFSAFPNHHLKHDVGGASVYKRLNASVPTAQITEARRLVDAAVAQQGEYNTWRVSHPRRNKDLQSRSGKVYGRDSGPVPPKLNSTLLAAAALLAEHDASLQAANGTLHKVYNERTPGKPSNGTKTFTHTKRKDSSYYWLAEIQHTGKAPMGQDDSWLVYRDVTDPMFAGGAKGDGVTDDTAAINAAIKHGGNCGSGCLSSSIKGTLIYFPPGTYLVSSPIQAYYYSQLVGHAIDKPIIKTSASFIGLGAIETDVYEENANGGEWYINQSNFYRQVRNFVIDIQDTTTASVAGLHWQVAQSTSLTNVHVYAPTSEDTTAMGMFTENGSSETSPTGFMGECSFNGGAYGIYGGNQQYTVRSFSFHEQTKAAICLIWDWGWTWSNLFITDTPIGILLLNPDDKSAQPAGSIYVMDSSFASVGAVLHANAQSKTILDSSIITLDNIGVADVGAMVTFEGDGLLLIPTEDIDFYILGNVQEGGSFYGIYGLDVKVPSPLLTSAATRYRRDSYFVKSRPQYAGLGTGDIVNVKEHGAKGDGKTDDTAAIRDALSMATKNNLVYFPAGSYIVTSTVDIKPGTRITGEVWSQLVASGSYFADLMSPKVMLRVGQEGDVGTVEISDMLFTSVGPLSGLVMVEWNMAEEDQGSVGLWDAHFRVGGAAGTKLQVADCPKGAALRPECVAASMMFHMTSKSSGYFENMWGWVADHDLDDPQNTMISVVVARGFLIESKGPTWLYGTSSEHSVFYQYNFYGSANTFAGMIQTESPYFQATPGAESPSFFASSTANTLYFGYEYPVPMLTPPETGIFNNDPEFNDPTCKADPLLCNFSWGVMIEATRNLTIAGAGLYSWFSNYDQSVCVDAQNCQQRMLLNQGGNVQLYIWNLITITTQTAATAHPFWSVLGAYLDSYDSDGAACDDDNPDPACYANIKCDYSLRYDTFEALEAASSSWPATCMDYYALGVLNAMLGKALSDFKEIDNGYDVRSPPISKYINRRSLIFSPWQDVFGTYSEYVKQMVPNTISSFMEGSTPGKPLGGDGNKYFSCELVTGSKGENHEQFEHCPVPWQKTVTTDAYDIYYTLKDENGFFDELKSKYAILKSWVSFVGYQGGPKECPLGDGSAHGHIVVRAACAVSTIAWHGLPETSGNIEVGNPKDVIKNALPNIEDLRATILGRELDLALGLWTGPTDDILQVHSVPVFNIVQAIAQMADAKKTGKEIKADMEKKNKMNLILEILGIVFAFVPFLDEIAPEMESLTLVLDLVTLGVNTGITIADIIQDPQTAPMEIMMALTGGFVRNEKKMETLATARRAATKDMGKIGKTFDHLDKDFQSMLSKHRACKI
ncbi:exo-1-3-beta-D-glucanase [Apiospora rasikravindrae]|uniref:Exo-1-3-beta-D-glucanase n=1 Tax=Apiospora rasikravindrae TaxID=990691 RepID=A0ABR1TEC5_9PEZI